MKDRYKNGKIAAVLTVNGAVVYIAARNDINYEPVLEVSSSFKKLYKL